MTTKTFEIRDIMTSISVMAIKLDPVTEGDKFLVRRAGFTENYIILMSLYSLETIYNSREWSSNTMREAHAYIYDHFDELESGSVIDVEFIRGETDKPKNSERVT